MLIRFENGETIQTEMSLGVHQLDGLDLHRATLDHLNLEGFVFCTSHLRGTSLRFCNLRNANLEMVKMMTSAFCYSDLKSVSANNSKAMYCSFIHCNLSFSSFLGSDLRGSNFESANILGVDFRCADLSDASFKNAKFDSTTLWPQGYKPEV